MDNQHQHSQQELMDIQSQELDQKSQQILGQDQVSSNKSFEFLDNKSQKQNEIISTEQQNNTEERVNNDQIIINNSNFKSNIIPNYDNIKTLNNTQITNTINNTLGKNIQPSFNNDNKIKDDNNNNENNNNGDQLNIQDQKQDNTQMQLDKIEQLKQQHDLEQQQQLKNQGSKHLLGTSQIESEYPDRNSLNTNTNFFNNNLQIINNVKLDSSYEEPDNKNNNQNIQENEQNQDQMQKEQQEFQQSNFFQEVQNVDKQQEQNLSQNFTKIQEQQDTEKQNNQENQENDIEKQNQIQESSQQKNQQNQQQQMGRQVKLPPLQHNIQNQGEQQSLGEGTTMSQHQLEQNLSESQHDNSKKNHKKQPSTKAEINMDSDNLQQYQQQQQEEYQDQELKNPSQFTEKSSNNQGFQRQQSYKVPLKFDGDTIKSLKTGNSQSNISNHRNYKLEQSKLQQSQANLENYMKNRKKKKTFLVSSIGQKSFVDMNIDEQHEWLGKQFNKYQPDKKPFDLQLAFNHQQASRVKKEEKERNMNISYLGHLQDESCPCCHLPIYGQKIDFNAPYTDLSHLGPAYPLYFKFMQQSLYFLLIIVLLSGIPMIIQNVQGNKCEEHEDKNHKCSVSFYQTFATSNRGDEEYTIYDELFNFLCCIVQMFYVLFFFRKSLKQLEKLVDNKDVSVSDYSLMISHIPQNQSRKDIQKFFEGLNSKINQQVVGKELEKQIKNIERNMHHDDIKGQVKQKLELARSIFIETQENKKDHFEGHNEGDQLKDQIVVQKIVYSYKIKELLKWKQQLEDLEILEFERQYQLEFIEEQEEANEISKQDLEELKKGVIELPKDFQEQKEEIQHKIEIFESECLNKEHSFKGNLKENKHFTGVIFISFKTEKMAMMIKEYFSYDFLNKYFSLIFPPKDKLYNGNKITVNYAPEPGDIIWENLGAPTYLKVCRRISTFFGTVIILGVCFTAILFISVWQKELSEQDTAPFTIILISGLSSIAIMIVNSVLGIAISKFAEYEIYSNNTDHQTSVAKKLGIAQFVNTAIISFAVNLIVHGKDLFAEGGLISDIMSLMLLNTVVPPFMNFFDVGWFMFKYLPRQFYIKFEKQRYRLSQQKANELFEERKLDPSQRFANIIKTLLFATFYAYLIPLGSLLCMVSLFFQFWMEWYLIIRNQSNPVPIGAQLIHQMVDFFIELLIISFCLGCLIFELLLYDEVSSGIILMNILSIIYWLLPMDQIVVKLFGFDLEDNKHLETHTYAQSKARFQFTSDYDRSNPVNQRIALKEYINYEIDICHKRELFHKQNTSQLFKGTLNDSDVNSLIQKELKLNTDMGAKLNFFQQLFYSNESQDNKIYVKQQKQNKWSQSKKTQGIFDIFSIPLQKKLIFASQDQNQFFNTLKVAKKIKKKAKQINNNKNQNLQQVVPQQ